MSTRKGQRITQDKQLYNGEDYDTKNIIYIEMSQFKTLNVVHRMLQRLAFQTTAEGAVDPD